MNPRSIAPAFLAQLADLRFRPLSLAHSAARPAQRIDRRRAQSGAVLLEVVLALVLFAAAAAIVVAGMNASVNSVERLRLNTHAVNLASTVLAELQLGLRSLDALGPEDFEAPFEGWSWELSPTSESDDLATGPRLTKVEVIIRHADPPLVYRMCQVLQVGDAAELASSPTPSSASSGF